MNTKSEKHLLFIIALLNNLNGIKSGEGNTMTCLEL